MAQRSGIDVKGLEQATRQLDALAMGPGDWEQFYRGPGENRVREFWERVFETEGVALLGGTWAPLAPLTLKLRQRRGRGRGGIGRDTSVLMSSLSKRGSPDGVSTSTGPASWLYGTMVPYAARFNEGGPITQIFRNKITGNRRQPARPLVTDPMPRSFMSPLEEALAAFLTRKAERAIP